MDSIKVEIHQQQGLLSVWNNGRPAGTSLPQTHATSLPHSLSCLSCPPGVYP